MDSIADDTVDELRSLGWRRSTLRRSKSKRADALPIKHFNRVRRRDILVMSDSPRTTKLLRDLGECR